MVQSRRSSVNAIGINNFASGVDRRTRNEKYRAFMLRFLDADNPSVSGRSRVRGICRLSHDSRPSSTTCPTSCATIPRGEWQLNR